MGEDGHQRRHWQPKWTKRRAPADAWFTQQQRRGNLQTVTVALSPHQSVQVYQANGDYGTRLWPSAKQLAQWFAANSDADGLAGGLRVLEVGCGNGMCAITLALAGCQVVATDNDPQALKLTEAAAKAAGVSDRVRTVIFDICDARKPLPSDCDVLVAADVMYSEVLASALARRCEQAVTMGARALIADPGRPTRRHFHDALAASTAAKLSAHVLAMNQLGAVTFGEWASGTKETRGPSEDEEVNIDGVLAGGVLSQRLLMLKIDSKDELPGGD